MTRRTLAALATALAALALPAAASAAVTTHPIDGPSADIQRFSDIAMAPDGTAALVYIKKVGAVDHVFASVRSGGVWGAPVRVDTGVEPACNAATDPSLRPAVAAANGGRIVVTYLNGNTANPNKALCGAVKANATSAFAQPVAINPNPQAQYQDLAMNATGTAFVTYTDFNFDIRAERLRPADANWIAVGAAAPDPDGVLDRTATDHSGDSGSNPSGPVITVTPAGEAVVAFSTDMTGQPQDIVVRRLKDAHGGAGPNPGDFGPAQTADAATLGPAAATGTVSDMPSISSDATGAAWVVFREFFNYTLPANQDVPRGIAAKLTGDTIGTPAGVDGLPQTDTSPLNGVEFPSISVNGAGQALLAFARQNAVTGNGANEVRAASLLGATWTPLASFDPTPSTAPPAPSSAIGGNGDGVIAWRNQLSMTSTEVKVRQRVAGAFGVATTVSNPAFGTALALTDAPAAAASLDGTSVVGFSQGSAATSRIVVATVTPPPGGGGGGGGGGGTGGGGPTAHFGAHTKVFLKASGRRLSRKRRFGMVVRNANAFTVNGRLTLVSKRKLRIGGHKRRLTLGSHTVRLTARHRKTVHFRASPKEARALKKAGKVRIAAGLRVTDPAGNRRRVPKAFTLKPAKPRHRHRHGG